ncbi:MAG: hypothetical protein XD50_0020 [Clostridia bacterium 41_269]|nr:MAG: hypothetical protein XD50_0020 [Clostridia bacterium 41_269]
MLYTKVLFNISCRIFLKIDRTEDKLVQYAGNTYLMTYQY